MPSLEDQPAIDERIADLRTRLDRYPPQRYPVQHATAQFHLGTALLQHARATEAVTVLGVAEEIFDVVGLALERAKAANMRGVALRESGSGDRAVEAFARAAQGFRALRQVVEEAAALYNLGMAYGDTMDVERAGRAFSHAAQLFTAAGRVSEAAAAAREQGTVLLRAGEVTAAVDLLDSAARLAFDSGDLPGGGAAANALGLAELALGDPVAAVAAFRDAVGAHPRSVRPAEYAMAKANLALALERAVEPARARLAALQSLGIPAAAAPVRAQAEQIVKRLPAATSSELFDVLADTPTGRWAGVIREEALRWADAAAPVRAAAVDAWVDGQLRRHGRGAQLAEGLLGALLELAPVAYQSLVRAVVAATARRSAQDAALFRAAVRSAMARFPLPQWQRLAATFNAASAELGEPAEWS